MCAKRSCSVLVGAIATMVSNKRPSVSNKRNFFLYFFSTRSTLSPLRTKYETCPQTHHGAPPGPLRYLKSAPALRRAGPWDHPGGMLKPLSLVCHPPPPRPPPHPFLGVEVRSSPRIFLLCRVVASGWRLIFWRCLVAVARGGVCSKKKNDFCELSGNMAGENANFSDKNVGKFWILGLGVISAVYFVMVCQKNDFYNHFSAFIWCFLVILLMSRKIFWRFSVILTSLVKQFDVFGCFRFFLSLKCVQKGAAACWWVRLQRWYQTTVLFHVFNVFK